ncbi:MAG: hypothetical protein LUG91_02705 [Ruminococcus sp.]|nr:hypothetical protein [Ruminococcus sp.]
MRKRVSQKITAVIVFAFILAFLAVTIVREKGKMSYQENRELAQMPEISAASLLDGSYFDELGTYLSDHFAGRSHWIYVKGEIDAEVGESIVNGVFIADNMLLSTSSCEIDNVEDIAAAFNEYTASYSGSVYLVAVPSSSGVYSELLPDYLENDTEKQQIDSLYSQLDSSIRTIDAYNILKMLNENYIYYRNDSKWTSYGAYCVYRTVIQKLGFIPTAYDKYTIEHITGDFRGNLYNITQYNGVKADMLDIYNYADGAEVTECTGYNAEGKSFEMELYDRSAIYSCDMYNLYLGEAVPMIKISTSVNNDKKLLVIKDSTADCFIPFLIQHYSEIAVISPECLTDGMSTLLNKNGYEQTLFLFGTDQFPDAETLEVIND